MFLQNKKNGQSLEGIASIIVVLFVWVLVCHFLKVHSHYYIITVVTGLSLLATSFFMVQLSAPELSKKFSILLMGLLAVKMVISVVYFNHFFVARDSLGLSIIKYGDNYLYHNAALEFLEIWPKYGMNLIGEAHCLPGHMPTSVSNWGYAAFLAVIYWFAGIVPEAGVLFNTFLAFTFCLLSYKLFVVAGLSTRQASSGLVILFFCPGLWLWSSLLYKDSLIFLIVMACMLTLFRMGEKISLIRLSIVVVLLSALLPLRYSYTAPLMTLLVLGPLYLKKRSFRQTSLSILIACFVLMSVFAIQLKLNLMSTCIPPVIALNSPSVVEGDIYNEVGGVINSATAVMDLTPTGGNFMSSGIGSIHPSITNFWYTLPARAVYILMIPMPWFGGHSVIERTDYLFSHLDAVYDVTLLMAVLIMFFRNRLSATKEQNVLLIIGMAYFAMPLFFYFPGRRYITIAFAFFLAYSLPVLLQRRGAIASAMMAVIFISVVQFAYMLKS